MKPANLFLARRPDGKQRIKVLDFGISKSLEAFPDLGETKAPELFQQVATQHEARRLGIVRYADTNVEKGAYDVKAFPMPQNCFGVLFENLSNQPT